MGYDEHFKRPWDSLILSSSSRSPPTQGWALLITDLAAYLVEHAASAPEELRPAIPHVGRHVVMLVKSLQPPVNTPHLLAR